MTTRKVMLFAALLFLASIPPASAQTYDPASQCTCDCKVVAAPGHQPTCTCTCPVLPPCEVPSVANAASAPSRPWPAATPAPASTKPWPATAPAIPNKGELVILVQPKALVEIDGVKRGEGTEGAFTLAAGDHKLRISREGYQPIEALVKIQAGRRATGKASLDLKAKKRRWPRGFEPNLAPIRWTEEPMGVALTATTTSASVPGSFQPQDGDGGEVIAARIEADGFLLRKEGIWPHYELDLDNNKPKIFLGHRMPHTVFTVDGILKDFKEMSKYLGTEDPLSVKVTQGKAVKVGEHEIVPILSMAIETGID